MKMTTPYPLGLLLLAAALCCVTVQEATAQTTDAFSSSAIDTAVFNPFLTLDYSSFAAGQFGLPQRTRRVFAEAASSEPTAAPIEVTGPRV